MTPADNATANKSPDLCLTFTCLLNANTKFGMVLVRSRATRRIGYLTFSPWWQKRRFGTLHKRISVLYALPYNKCESGDPGDYTTKVSVV
jgi:hypothetical protein